MRYRSVNVAGITLVTQRRHPIFPLAASGGDLRTSGGEKPLEHPFEIEACVILRDVGARRLDSTYPLWTLPEKQEQRAENETVSGGMTCLRNCSSPPFRLPCRSAEPPSLPKPSRLPLLIPCPAEPQALVKQASKRSNIWPNFSMRS